MVNNVFISQNSEAQHIVISYVFEILVFVVYLKTAKVKHPFRCYWEKCPEKQAFLCSLKADDDFAFHNGIQFGAN